MVCTEGIDSTVVGTCEVHVGLVEIATLQTQLTKMTAAKGRNTHIDRVCKRERGRETDRQTDRPTDRQTETETETHRERERGRERG